MAREAGTKNKATILKMDSEDIFLADALERYTFWKAQAVKAKDEGGTGEREREYAEFYRIGLNKFSTVEA